jgi:16S rRNA (uracil1498-N3)-methyltransferase
MRRFVVAELPTEGTTTFTLDTTTSHYAAKVLRLSPPERIELVDGHGGQAIAELAGGDSATGLNARLVSLVRHPIADLQVTVAAALLKGPRWEVLLEKASELGAHRVVPVSAARSVVKIADKDRANKQQRWQKICDGATRQSGGLWRCEVQPPERLDDVLATLDADTIGLFADESQTGAPWPDSLRRGAPDSPREVVVFVGPEGGFTDEERRRLRGQAQVVGLGARILRGETAGVAALSILMALREGLV